MTENELKQEIELFSKYAKKIFTTAKKEEREGEINYCNYYGSLEGLVKSFFFICNGKRVDD